MIHSRRVSYSLLILCNWKHKWCLWQKISQTSLGCVEDDHLQLHPHTSRDFTFIEDVIQANLRAAISTKSDGHVVNVAYGDRFTLTELANKVIENICSSSTIEYADFRKGDVLHSLADLSITKELIDYNPEFDLSKGLAKTIKFYRSLIDYYKYINWSLFS